MKKYKSSNETQKFIEQKPVLIISSNYSLGAQVMPLSMVMYLAHSIGVFGANHFFFEAKLGCTAKERKRVLIFDDKKSLEELLQR